MSTNMASTNNKLKLSLATYLCPSLPVELFQLLAEFLEQDLGCEVTLVYEWRASGPLPDRADPFADNTVHLAFVSVPTYERILSSGAKSSDLLPVAAVFKHPKNKEHVKGYYSDIIIHVDQTKHVNEFLNLRGCTWAYSNEESLSSSTVVLRKLKEAGEKATFFGNKLKAGSHLNAIEMVRSKQADAAAVDANALAHVNKNLLEKDTGEIKVLTSIGPLPPYPILVNATLPEPLRQQIASSLLAMSSRSGWADRLLGFGVEKFVTNGPEAYDAYTNLQSEVKGMSLNQVYYY